MTKGMQLPSERAREFLIHVLAWGVACAALLNACLFVWHTANPVLRSDAWYSLDVFVRKAVEGHLGLADFFTRRYVDDHAQPLLKLIELAEWRWFDLDCSVGSMMGLLAACVLVLILHRVTTTTHGDNEQGTHRFVAWATLTAVLLSLNASGIWTWPMAALGYVTFVPVLLFYLVVWRALRRRSLALLTIATFLLCALADDVAMIAEISVVLALALLVWRAPGSSWGHFGKMVVVMAACTGMVRIAYGFAPLLDGTPGMSLAARVMVLVGELRSGEAWQWIAIPFSRSVAWGVPFKGIPMDAWRGISTAFVMWLLLAHVAFWWRASRGEQNLSTFVAMGLMLLSYGLLAGIILVRVSLLGSGYLGQERYVEFYQINLVALLLMWAGTRMPGPLEPMWRRVMLRYVPTLGCAILLLLQLPLARMAWLQRPYEQVYYARMADQINQLAAAPEQTTGCLPELVVCRWPLERRQAVLHLLGLHRLNVFSPRVQAWHVFLPRLESGARQSALATGATR
ncbi:hypothetical protein [Rhodanobacter hydrolyticus]|uniref:Glycosyltransferase RgtA/B/C/D-like domain-containing protein n=1 Tax=Rhodanobacter hydrolyticus TaxID=2250595 RepID=A0ABW8JB84_9GAMM